MGEQIKTSAAGHLSPIMRSSRGKLFLYLLVLGIMCTIMFLLSNAHSNLKQLENVNEKCQQQRDSLSAQLQVVYEHKYRLEQSLQQEKSEHKHTKEEIEKQIQNEETKILKEKKEKQELENQMTQLRASFAQLELEKSRSEATLKEQLQSLGSQKDEEIKKLQEHVTELMSDKDALELAKNEMSKNLQKFTNDAALCRAEHEQVMLKLSECVEQLQKTQNAKTQAAENPAEGTVEKTLNPAITPTPFAVKDKLVPIARPLSKPAEERSVDAANAPPAKAEDIGAGLPLKEEAQAVSKNNSADDADRQLPPPFSDSKNEVKREDAENNVPVDLIGNEGGHMQQDLPLLNNLPAEKGENIDAMDPLEQPQLKAFNGDLKKNEIHLDNKNYDVAADQMRDMMDKSPGNANAAVVPQPIPPMPNKFGFNRNGDEMKAELPVPDRNYLDGDDEDQDGENEDDPIGRIHGPNPRFPGQDFDEAEPDIAGINNNIDKESVQLAPR